MKKVRVESNLKPETEEILSNHAKQEGVSRGYVINQACEQFAKKISKGAK